MAITEAVHLVAGDSAGGHVKQATKLAGVSRYVRILGEQLTIGPCDVDPERHVELRRAWNAEVGDEYTKTFGIDDLRAAVALDLPIVVWATRAYADIVWLWWILDGLERLKPLWHPTLIARPEPDDQLATVGGIEPEKGVEALADARRISDDEFLEGAELWRLFASPDPRAFDDVRRRESSAFPELHESAEFHGAWFPRLADGRLYLSEYDQCLLASLTDEWLRPRDLLMSTIKMPALRTFGSYSVPVWRLRAWAARGVAAREPRGYANGNRLEQDVFRLTDRARALLGSGMETVGDAPPVCVGGCRIYDPVAQWVRVSDESGWRITAHT